MSAIKNQAITHFNDGNKLYKINLFKEALEQYQKAIENDPTFYDAHFCIAKTELRLKEFNAGINHFSKYVHLIPKGKQGAYILALSNILLEENKPLEALKLTESIDVQFTEEQTFKYIPLLLANNKTAEAIHKVLNLKDKSKISIGYSKVLEDQTIPEKIITELKKDNIIPRFFNTVKKVQLLKNAGIQHKEYNNLIEEISSKLSELRKNKNSNYVSEFEASDEIIVKAQSLLAKQTETILKTKNFASTKKLITVLEQTKYDSKITNNLTKELNRKEKSKSQKTLKIAGISIASVVILSLVGYFGYNSYQKSEAREYTLRNATINSYTNYLNKYGSDKEIDKLREDKLYEIALNSNDAKDFELLYNYYPNSELIKTVSIDVKNGNSTYIQSYGLGNQNLGIKTQSSKAHKIKVPLGAKIKYKYSEYNKHTIERVLTVVEDLNITENAQDYKTEVFRDDFENNKNNWNLNTNITKLRYTLNKISIEKGHLVIENGRKQPSLLTFLNKTIVNKNDDFEIVTRVKANRYFTNGFHILFDATDRAFSYAGYAGATNNSQFNLGHNNWNDSSNNWISYVGGWTKNTYGKEDATLSIRKENNKVYYSINGALAAESTLKKKYGNKIGFHSTPDTKTRIDYLVINKINKKPKTQFIKGNTYFCWVDELNVRSNATKKGEIITTIKLAEPVRFKGGIGEKTVNATFKGIFSPEKYYEVELLDGTIGWVHGGALNAIPSDKNIDFKAISNSNIPITDSVVPTTDDSEFYMIAVYAESNETTIKNRVKELKSKGFNTNYLWIPDYKSLSGANMYSAYVGPFPTKEACKKALVETKSIYPKAYGLLASKNTTQRITVK